MVAEGAPSKKHYIGGICVEGTHTPIFYNNLHIITVVALCLLPFGSVAAAALKEKEALYNSVPLSLFFGEVLWLQVE